MPVGPLHLMLAEPLAHRHLKGLARFHIHCTFQIHNHAGAHPHTLYISVWVQVSATEIRRADPPQIGAVLAWLDELKH